MADAATSETQPPAKGGSKKLIIIGAVVLVLLLAGGGGAWFFLAGGDPAAEQTDAAAPAVPAPAIYLPLEPAFLANYTVDGRPRYLQVSMAVMARDQAAIDALTLHMPAVRNRIVMLLSGADFAAMQTEAGRQQLQADALVAIQELLERETGQGGAEQVLFTNLVMQ